jgi:hypothetical protein
MLTEMADYHRCLHLKKLNEIKMRKNQFIENNKRDLTKLASSQYCINS